MYLKVVIKEAMMDLSGYSSSSTSVVSNSLSGEALIISSYLSSRSFGLNKLISALFLLVLQVVRKKKKKSWLCLLSPYSLILQASELLKILSLSFWSCASPHFQPCHSWWCWSTKWFCDQSSHFSSPTWTSRSWWGKEEPGFNRKLWYSFIIKKS